MLSSLIPIIIVVVPAILVGLVLMILLWAFYVKVPQGSAMIINDLTPLPKVCFTGSLVLPVIHKKEFMCLALVTVEISRRSRDGLLCKDNLRADISVVFYLRVNPTADDVLKAARAVGVDRASDPSAVSALFKAKFSDALSTAAKEFEFEELITARLKFRERIREIIGYDLNGYILEDVAIDYLEQTPINK